LGEVVPVTKNILKIVSIVLKIILKNDVINNNIYTSIDTVLE
jgi:hypothetical protein